MQKQMRCKRIFSNSVPPRFDLDRNTELCGCTPNIVSNAATFGDTDPSGKIGIMEFQRSSGVLLHVSSLPSYGGIGDLGPAAHEFVAFLARAKQHVWQVLPLCPTGFGNSPYAGSSAFAGNPALISLEFLANWGWIDGARIAGLAGRSGAVDFDEVARRKLPLLQEAAGTLSRMLLWGEDYSRPVALCAW